MIRDWQYDPMNLRQQEEKKCCCANETHNYSLADRRHLGVSSDRRAAVSVIQAWPHCDLRLKSGYAVLVEWTGRRQRSVCVCVCCVCVREREREGEGSVCV